MINRTDNFSFIFEKWEVNNDFHRVDTESRLDESYSIAVVKPKVWI